MSEVDAWVSSEFERLAQVINDYDQYLFLEMIPVAHRESLIDKSQSFRIVDSRNNKIVLFASSLSNPTEILERLWSMDSGKGNVLARVDAHNAAVEALKLREQIDAREAQKDLAAFVIRGTKSVWKYQGRKYDDEFRDLGTGRTVIDK